MTAILRHSASRLLAAAILLLLAPGCASIQSAISRPGSTRLAEPLVILPAERLGNLLLIQAKWDRSGPYRFLIDTGSSATLVSPEFARRYGVSSSQPPAAPEVVIGTARGAARALPATTVKRIELGDARFDDVPALVLDTEPLSLALGVKVDGILGFPLFRETVLTLDYPASQVRLARLTPDHDRPGTTIPFNNQRKIPAIPIRVGDASPLVLIDSGSDGPLSLNRVGLPLTFAVPPRPGGLTATLTGDEPRTFARLDGVVGLGDLVLDRPVVQLTDGLSAIGGGVLQHFTVTFDQAHNEVTFYREGGGPVTMAPIRSPGLSFTNKGVYWQVAAVIPQSPAAASPIQPGDLVVRIDGEPINQWDRRRFDHLVASAREVTYTLQNGTRESHVTVATYELVP
jgi:hypothetical protein